jgi:signal peptidase I
MKNVFFPLAIVGLLVIGCSKDDEQMIPIFPSVINESKLVTTSNTSGKISYTNLLASSPETKNLTITSTDADGAYYDSSKDEFILASRTNNRLELYKGVSSSVKNNTDNVSLQFSSTASEFNNPREIFVVKDKVVVTQDQNAANGNTNKFLVYQKTTSSFNLLNSYTLNFKVWGIHIDGTTLYAIADLTGDVVVFNDFFSNADGAITPTKRVTIEGLIRTHGITFSKTDNRMILTDVGSAASDVDGGLIVINNFSNVIANTSNGGTVALADQIRIYGPNSKLGNPVDVAYDNVTNKIYVAERLNAGGQVLTFALPTSTADATPEKSVLEPGVSSVYLIRK